MVLFHFWFKLFPLVPLLRSELVRLWYHSLGRPYQLESLSWASWEILLVGALDVAMVKLELQEHKILVYHSVVDRWNTTSYSGPYKLQKKSGITRKYEWMMLFINVYKYMLFNVINLSWVMSIVCQSRGSRRCFTFKLPTLLISFEQVHGPFPF